MKRIPQQFLFAVGARWAACGIVVFVLLRMGAFARPTNGVQLFLLSYSLVYTACWTWLLRRWWVRVRDGSWLLLYDLGLSALPVWAGGGWNSPFFPIALGALVIPALSLRWRSGLIAAACFTLIDQLILWSTTPTPWQIAKDGQSPWLLGRTLLPFGVVLALTGAIRLWYHRQQQTPDRRRGTAARQSSSSLPLRQNIAAFGGRAPSYERGTGAAQSTQTVRAVVARPPATIRQTPATLPLMLRQLHGELDAAGVSLAVHVEGDEQRLSPQVKTLLLRTLGVAVDNVLMHAHAKAVVLTIQIGSAEALLEVVDDGIGLWDGTAEPPGFHQIKRLRFRAEELGGALSVLEREQGGVALKLRVPLD